MVNETWVKELVRESGGAEQLPGYVSQDYERASTLAYASLWDFQRAGQMLPVSSSLEIWAMVANHYPRGQATLLHSEAQRAGPVDCVWTKSVPNRGNY